MTRFTLEYLEFRENLNNDQLLNFQAHLKNIVAQGGLAEDTLLVLEVGGAILFHIFVDKHSDTIWILGGHWVRKGEPNKTFLDRMNYYAAELLQGREPI